MPGLARPERHRRRGEVVGGEGDGVPVFAGERHERLAALVADEQPGRERRIGDLAVERMGVALARVAHRRHAAMDEEGAVGAEVVRVRPRLGEHRAHGQRPAVEHGVPDLLALEREEVDVPGGIPDAETGDAGSIAEGRGRHLAMRDEQALGLGEVLGPKLDGGDGHVLVAPQALTSLCRMNFGSR